MSREAVEVGRAAAGHRRSQDRQRPVDSARRGYREINLRALRLLTPSGLLITSSCSANLDEGSFEEVLVEAARDAGRTATIAARRGQAADHPILLGFPESRYLKCFVLREGGGPA